MYQVELDICANSKSELRDICAKYNISAIVLEWEGPAGGWPNVLFIGTLDLLRKFVLDLEIDIDTYVLEQAQMFYLKVVD